MLCQDRIFFGASQFNHTAIADNAECSDARFGKLALGTALRRWAAGLFIRLFGRQYRQVDSEGGSLGDEDARTITDAVWRHSVLFRWQEGDVLLLDNVNAMHARMPSYSAPGERVILTALANPFTIPSRL
jgi:hypothetical protein